MKQATREKMKAEYEAKKQEIQKEGYQVNKRWNNIYSFSKNNEASVLGFDSECEVVNFILTHKPEANKIFPPYKQPTKTTDKRIILCKQSLIK